MGRVPVLCDPVPSQLPPGNPTASLCPPEAILQSILHLYLRDACSVFPYSPCASRFLKPSWAVYDHFSLLPLTQRFIKASLSYCKWLKHNTAQSVANIGTLHSQILSNCNNFCHLMNRWSPNLLYPNNFWSTIPKVSTLHSKSFISIISLCSPLKKFLRLLCKQYFSQDL